MSALLLSASWKEDDRTASALLLSCGCTSSEPCSPPALPLTGSATNRRPIESLSLTVACKQNGTNSVRVTTQGSSVRVSLNGRVRGEGHCP